MKKIIIGLGAVLLLAFGLSTLTMLSSDNANASIYVYGYVNDWTAVTNSTGGPAGWNWVRQTQSFPGTANAVSNDTLFFIFNPQAPKQDITDTLIATIGIIAKPGTSYGAADSLQIKYEIWTSDDTSGWRKGSVTFNNGVWNKFTSEGTDSSVAGYVPRSLYVGANRHNGRHPYTALVAIGKNPSNGKANYVGNHVEVNVINQ